MSKFGLYIPVLKSNSYLKGHRNDDRQWWAIADSEDILQINVAHCGVQKIRYESGWMEEHKTQDYSRPLPYAQGQKREWMSEITLPDSPLKFWDEAMIGDDNISTFGVEADSSNFKIANGLMYCTGVGTHKDESNARRSALLIIHNEGFLIKQKGLSERQSVGKILLLKPQEEHSLEKTNALAGRWAAIFSDFEEDLSLKKIEDQLLKTCKRVFPARGRQIGFTPSGNPVMVQTQIKASLPEQDLDWLNSRPNKSETVRDAIAFYRQKH